MNYKKKVLLIILDGIGVAPKSEGNALALANTQNLIKLWEAYPGTYLEASGEDVGLIKDTDGNSEVGHLTIGSGKAHYQNLLKIENSIKKGIFFNNETLKSLAEHSVKNNSNIHLMGCLSDGAVHSHIDHFLATLDFLSKENIGGEVFIHAFTDGRDTPQRDAKRHFEKLEGKIKNLGFGKIASICGRAYAMDRNNIVERTKKALDLLLEGKGEKFTNWQEAIESSYEKGHTDEYIEPISLEESTVNDNDSILFMNFRPDRALQLTKAIDESSLKNIFLAGMVEYQKKFPNHLVFPKEYISLPLGRIISEVGYRQARIAESEKYPHVTYFFNGGQPIQYKGEDRISIPSPEVATYDLKPEMSAYGVANAVKQSITNKEKKYQFIVTNIANGDMVGHTGNLEASIQAMKVVDDVALKMIKTARALNWTIIITSDHGNVERLIDPSTQLPNTEHTQNPVPFLIIDEEIRRSHSKQLPLGSLSDIAPTILKLMGIKKPGTMTGRSLIA